MRKKKEVRTLHPYGSGLFYRVPVGIKVALMKWWAAGAVYFFMGFGAPPELQGTLFHIISLGMVLGLLNSYVVYPVIRDMTRMGYDENPYIIVRRRGVKGTIVHLGVNISLVILVVYAYEAVNSFGNFLIKPEFPVVLLPAEPLLFGLFYTLLEFFWRYLHNLVRKGRREKRNPSGSDPENNKE